MSKPIQKYLKNTVIVLLIIWNVVLVRQIYALQNPIQPIEAIVEEDLPVEEIPLVVEAPLDILSERDLIDVYIQEISTIYNMDPELIHSVIWHESRYKPNAINKQETCVGLMQVCPRWHKDRALRLGVTDFKDPYSSILLGVDYLAELRTRHKDIKLVLMLYNMNHKSAFALHEQGKTNRYTDSVLKRAKETIKGVK